VTNTRTQSGEDRIIALFRPLAQHPGAFGLMDDAAALQPPEDCDLVLTADAIVGGVHFFTDDPPGAVARKALRVNLSDLAAKGADLAGFLLTLALPGTADDEWLAAFARGLAADVEAFACPLLGGDTVKTPGPATISVAAFGFVPRGTMVRRGGARAGDAVVVTGTIGDAALGLRLRQKLEITARWGLDAGAHAFLVDRYLLPQPRNAIASAVRRDASAAMDVSDGLAGDLAKLCDASGVGAEVAVERMPLSEAARQVIARDPNAREIALTGGDDYEILCTMAADKAAAFRAMASAAGVQATEIGRITEGEGVRLLDEQGRPLTLARTSYSHF
jgi:thiamine-monophosphate kinase